MNNISTLTVKLNMDLINTYSFISTHLRFVEKITEKMGENYLRDDFNNFDNNELNFYVSKNDFEIIINKQNNILNYAYKKENELIENIEDLFKLAPLMFEKFENNNIFFNKDFILNEFIEKISPSLSLIDPSFQLFKLIKDLKFRMNIKIKELDNKNLMDIDLIDLSNNEYKDNFIINLNEIINIIKNDIIPLIENKTIPSLTNKNEYLLNQLKTNSNMNNSQKLLLIKSSKRNLKNIKKIVKSSNNNLEDNIDINKIIKKIRNKIIILDNKINSDILLYEDFKNKIQDIKITLNFLSNGLQKEILKLSKKIDILLNNIKDVEKDLNLNLIFFDFMNENLESYNQDIIVKNLKIKNEEAIKSFFKVDLIENQRDPIKKSYIQVDFLETFEIFLETTSFEKQIKKELEITNEDELLLEKEEANINLKIKMNNNIKFNNYLNKLNEFLFLDITEDFQNFHCLVEKKLKEFNIDKNYGEFYNEILKLIEIETNNSDKEIEWIFKQFIFKKIIEKNNIIYINNKIKRKKYEKK